MASKTLSEYTQRDVLEWINGLDVPQRIKNLIIKTVQENDITGDKLNDITVSELKDLGVTSYAASILLKQIEKSFPNRDRRNNNDNDRELVDMLSRVALSQRNAQTHSNETEFHVRFHYDSMSRMTTKKFTKNSTIRELKTHLIDCEIGGCLKSIKLLGLVKCCRDSDTFEQCGINARIEVYVKKVYQSIADEDKPYYDQCKLYFEITHKPLVTINIDINNNENNNNEDMKSVADNDSDNNEFEIEICMNQDINEFNENEFISKYCKTMGLQESQIEIVSVKSGSAVVMLKVHNVTIKVMSDKLTDESKLEELTKELKVFALMMNKPSKKPDIKRQRIRKEAAFLNDFNRKYGPGSSKGDTYWAGALNDGRNRGGTPYYCPVGWKRYTLQIRNLDGKEFAKKYDNWHLFYHGTKFQFGLSILLSGACGSYGGAYGKGLYLTPSIIYAAHPRYAEPKQIPSKHKQLFVKNYGINENNGCDFWVQFVLQMRVNPNALKECDSRKPETLGAANVQIDPNFSNKELEWVIKSNDNYWDFSDSSSDVICSGVMIRITDKEPKYLKESKWWKQNFNNKPYDAKYVF